MTDTEKLDVVANAVFILLDRLPRDAEVEAQLNEIRKVLGWGE